MQREPSLRNIGSCADRNDFTAGLSELQMEVHMVWKQLQKKKEEKNLNSMSYAIKHG